MSGLAILCSGQGYQSPDLLAKLGTNPEAMRLFDSVSDLLPDALRNPFSGLDPDAIFLDRVSQPLICLYQRMAWEILQPRMPDPALYAGYSLGEFSSYSIAGVFPPDAAIRLACRRAELMDLAAQETPSGLMAVLGLSPDAVVSALGKSGGALAIVIGPEHVVVGAARDAFEDTTRALLEAGARRVIPLQVPLASHTPFLAKATPEFSKELHSVNMAMPLVPILSGVTGDVVFTPDQAVKALAGQISTTIRWDACMETALSRECRVFLELGPGRDLAHMVLDAAPGIASRSLDEFKDIGAAADWAVKALSRA